MSEIINNRQQRVEIMKSLVRQLHNGVSEEQVKHQLETMLDEADYEVKTTTVSIGWRF